MVIFDWLGEGHGHMWQLARYDCHVHTRHGRFVTIESQSVSHRSTSHDRLLDWNHVLWLTALRC